MKLKQLNKALEYVDKGIYFSKKHSYMRFLPELLARKSRLLLEMNKRNEAKELFKDTLSFYRLLKSDSEIIKLENEIKESFT